MLNRIVIAVLVAVIVGFVLAVVLGPALLLLHTPPTEFIGGILRDWGWPIGAFVGLWYFFTNGGIPFVP